ncbi:hypothetical protein EDC04DRAFT_2599890 [Pisolithus marmoratus]|nr:hypothetical protein EDC04DRAFT_2599890 [Pisolithus marmoratus]
MQQVEKLPQASKSRGSRSSEDGDSEPTSDGPNRTSRKADLDSCLTQWHLKLHKAYKNKSDEGLMYIGPHGPIPLMPAMVCNWCLALEDGQATIITPPNIESFNLANKAPILHPACKAAAQPLNTSLLHSLTSPAPTPPTPQTPIQHQVHSTSSLPAPSPSQVACYLWYAEANLGSETERLKRVYYKKQFHTGGGSHFTVVPMQQDEDNSSAPLEQDYDLFYFYETLKQWFPIPHGYIVDESGESIMSKAYISKTPLLFFDVLGLQQNFANISPKKGDIAKATTFIMTSWLYNYSI